MRYLMSGIVRYFWDYAWPTVIQPFSKLVVLNGASISDMGWINDLELVFRAIFVWHSFAKDLGKL